ncbi:hypothetical protein [Asticcacaulis excentricus]|uniref:hypothetical protein n=1 Tax=Asticcacaulis excentricus TaxID=78587 RepID=UPI000F82F547|nr:hypothetical protein [Asticcacaulis excentricus]
MRLMLALSFIAILSACASTPVPAPPAYTFRVVDEPQDRRFVFEFVSQDDRALCVSGDDWAFVNKEGALAGPNRLQTASGPLKAKAQFYTDAGLVCGLTRTLDCGKIRVEPRQELRTEVGYELFPNAETLVSDKNKHFILHPDYPFVSVCKQQSRQTK